MKPLGVTPEVRALLAEAERASAAAKFEDMGYDDCDVCRQARLRRSFCRRYSEIQRQRRRAV